jgi:tetratricopeptide (TPR) repeat protein
MGRPEGMIEPLEEVVRRCPDSAGFRALLGESYLSAGRLDDALRELERAQELDASYDPTYYYLGRVHARMGNPKKAIACLEATLELNPTSLLARRDLGVLLWQEGDHEGALSHFVRITEEDPNSAQAWLQVANVQAELGRWPAAAAALERATDLTPGDWGLVNFRAWVLSTAPDDSVVDGDLAVELAERMIAGAGDQDPNLLDTLAAAYARAGRFTEAVTTARRALELARNSQDERLAKEIAERIELYEGERPYQDG